MVATMAAASARLVEAIMARLGLAPTQASALDLNSIRDLAQILDLGLIQISALALRLGLILGLNLALDPNSIRDQTLMLVLAHNQAQAQAQDLNSNQALALYRDRTLLSEVVPKSSLVPPLARSLRSTGLLLLQAQQTHLLSMDRLLYQAVRQSLSMALSFPSRPLPMASLSTDALSQASSPLPLCSTSTAWRSLLYLLSDSQLLVRHFKQAVPPSRSTAQGSRLLLVAPPWLSAVQHLSLLQLRERPLRSQN